MSTVPDLVGGANVGSIVNADVRVVAGELLADRRAAISPECAKIIEQVRARCPGAFVDRVLKPSEVAPPVELTADEGQNLFAAAFARAAAGGAVPTAGTVLWVDGTSELLVIVGKVRVVTRDGFAVVGIPVQCDQTGGVEMVVSFALGSKDLPTGLVMTTERTPRGPAVIAALWGDRLIAAAWAALTELATSVAKAAGTDADGEHLLPAMLSATDGGFVVVPQARHPFDRAVVRRL